VPPCITAYLNEDKVELSKLLVGNASFNNLSVAKLERMVSSRYHCQKPHARDRIREEAKSITGGEREIGRGEGRRRDSKRPHGVAIEVVRELILAVLASKNARPQVHLVVPVCSRPGIYKSFEN